MNLKRMNHKNMSYKKIMNNKNIKMMNQKKKFNL